MKLRQVELPPDISGKLYLHSMPGRNEPLDIFFRQATMHEIDLVVCLAADEELSRLSPDYVRYAQEDALPFQRKSYVIEDYGIPSDLERFDNFLIELVQDIIEGCNVLIHCAAGIGRTGLAATGVLLQLGYPVQEAISTVSRAGSNPEIGKQGDFLLALDRYRSGYIGAESASST